jgi:hypothetical protein
MLGAFVSRNQFPVGHGGFHAGRIRAVTWLRSFPPLHRSTLEQKSFLDLVYVFDCGSEHPDAFTRSLQKYRSNYPDHLDFLFLSHIHADHINGVDRLLGYTVPRVLVLPYLDLEDVAAIALSDYQEGRFSASYREYLRDPGAWWRGRGVETIIFIQPGGDDGIAPVAPTPDQPIEGEGIPTVREGEIEQPDARLAPILQKPQGPIEPGLTLADPNSRALPKSNVLAGSGSVFRLEWRYEDKDAWRSADWFLVPYVNPVQQANRAAFRKALLEYLQLSLPTPEEFRARLLEELSSTEQAKALVDIYSENFGSNHNAVSLSLYSGPGHSEQSYRNRERAWHFWESSPNFALHHTHLNGQTPGGWLSTGDAMLKEKKRRLPWHQFFSRYEQTIGILTLPHHGSIHNFHEDVINWSRLHLVLATTVEAKGRVARIRETLDYAAAKGQIALVVDDQPASILTSESSRAFGL